MAEILNASQLVEQTKEEYRRNFGSTEIPVTTPAEPVLEAQRVAQGEGYGFFTPFYFPLGETKLASPVPVGWVKLREWFYKQMQGKKPTVSPDAAKIGSYWTLFDESNRSDFAGDGKFGLILARGRNEGLIDPEHICDVEKTSRRGVSMDEQDKSVFPELAKPMHLVDQIAQGLVVIRRPKAAEFNFAGNLRYKHLGEHPTWEGFEDHFGDDGRLIGGNSGRGGLSYVNYGWDDRHLGLIAFRPLVVFLSQPQNLVAW